MYLAGIHIDYLALSFGHNLCAGVAGLRPFSRPVPTIGASGRMTGTAWRIMLDPMRGAVGVVMLQERNQGCCDGCYLVSGATSM